LKGKLSGAGDVRRLAHLMNYRRLYGLSVDGVGRMRFDEHEAFEERAAIVEFDGGWPRPIAEAEARRMIGMQRWLEAHLEPPVRPFG
jgi:hypothetical protein